ncbi:PREDICTED: cylicin-1 [Condylura cristata]|uniref:cylicin-1 n=1 Tax=Condylura cristata TaxID=143302 RepID=UPI000642A9AC|nr:PREDICTED: cylicin-1 [Condylura cristata]
MSLPRMCLEDLIIEDIQTWNSLCRQEGNIRTDDNSLPINEMSRNLRNQQYLALTFSETSQPGRKKRSRHSETQITVPRHNKRCLKEVQKPAHVWIRHSLRKAFQRSSFYLIIRREVPFRHPYAPKVRSKKTESKNSKYNEKTTLKKDSEKNTSPHETTPESKKVLNGEKIKKGNQTSKTPSNSLHDSEKPKYKYEAISISKYLKTISMKNPEKENDSRKLSETDNESTCTGDTKSSKNNSGNKSDICLKNCPSMELEESGARSTDFNTWLNNFSQNNSKKPSKKESKKDSKKISDAETVDSKDAKTKRDSNKKDVRKDPESTDVESVDSKDEKKDSKKTKKDAKKGDKKKKDAGSTDTESIDSKETKRDSKKAKKDSTKGDKRKDARKDVLSTDTDSESEWILKMDIKDERKDKKNSKKDDQKKYELMAQYSTESESDLEFKIDKNSKIRKNIKNYDAKKNKESSDGSDEHSYKDSKKSEMAESVDADTEESVYMLKKMGIDESYASSTDSKNEVLESKRKYRLSRKTKFREKEKEKKRTGRIPPSRERPPLPPCEPFLSPPKVKRLCWCKVPPPPPKPRYAPLPEAKWIHKLL